MKPDQLNKDIPKILKELKKIAVVGISDKSHRDSHVVANFMINKGYQVFPVNPNYEEVLGRNCYSSLLEIEEKVELVDIFRKSEYVIPVVKEAIHVGAKAIWMQLGVINEDAAKLALDAGLAVVMNRCWKREYQYLMNG